MYSLPTQPRSPFRVFGNALKLYVYFLLVLLPFNLLYVLVSVVPNWFVHHYHQQPNTHLFFTQMMLASAIVGILEVIFFVAALDYGYRFIMKQKLSYFLAFWDALIRFPIYFLVVIATGVLTIIGYALFILPGIYLNVIFSFSIVFAVMYRVGVLGSIKQSILLVKNHWWRTFFVYFLAMILIVIIGVILEMILGRPILFLSGVAYSNIDYGMHISFIIISLFTFPYMIAVLLSIYHDLILGKPDLTE